MPEPYAAEPGETTAQSRRRGRPAQETSTSHTSESCPRLRRADRNRAGWCSSRAARAGNYRQLRRCRDAGTKKRGRRDRVAAQITKHENRPPPRRSPRPSRPGRLRRLRLWEFVAKVASQQALEDSFAHDPELFTNAKLRALREDVILLRNNFFEQAAIDRNQHPERGLTIFIHERHQLFSGAIAIEGAISLQGEQRPDARQVDRDPREIGGGEAALRQILLRKINAPDADVFFHIANNICQLKRQAATLGKWLSRRVAISENLDAHESHHRRHTVTILAQFLESLVTRDQRNIASILRPALIEIGSRTKGKLIEQADRNLISALRIGQRQ